MAETRDDDALAKDNLALFQRLKGWVKDSMERHGDWYREAEECFAFVAGRSLKGKGQWPGDTWDEMLDSGRQPVEFNRVGPIVDSVCGLEVNNRQETKYLPRTDGDVKVNERLSSLAEWARDETHAEDEESDGFRNAVICGRGATETRIDFDEEPTGKIVVDCLDPLEVGVDPASRKANFVNRRYSWRYRDIGAEEAKVLFPGFLPRALHASWAERIDTQDGGDGHKTDYPDETRPGLARDNVSPRICRVVQIEWYEQETVYLVAAPGADEPQEMAADVWEALEGAEKAGYQAQKIQRRTYKQAFLGRDAVLDVGEIPGFKINWITGRLDRNNGYHYGIVRPMRDPQMLCNKVLSQNLHTVNTNAKGGLLIEQGAFRNVRDAEKDWSNPAKTIVLNEGGLEKIKERTAPAIPQSLVQLQEFSLSSIRDVTGVSVEMLGLADRDQPASLEYQRRQSAMTILASLFNGLRRYRKLQGRTLLDQLKLLPPGVLVRVLIDPEVAMQEYAAKMMEWQQAAAHAQQMGQQPPPQPQPPGAEFLSTEKRGEKFDPARFGLGEDARFDVIVDETASSPNQKEATWAALQPFLESLPPKALKIALKTSPLPETVATELGDAIEEGSGGGELPQEVQQMIEQGQQRLGELEQENAALKSDKQADMAKAGAALTDSQTRRMTAEHEISRDEEMDELKMQVAVLMRAIGGLNASS